MNEIADNNHATKYFRALDVFANGDYALCIDDFLELSSAGDARASLYAAIIFDRGGSGVDQNWVQARDAYERSLTQCYLPAAALGLALLHYSGRGGAQDYAEAARLFSMIRENAFSQIMLGIMNLKGRGFVPNEDHALNHFEHAWALGHPLGLKNAAIIRFHRGQLFRSVCDFIRSAGLIFWHYGVKKLPLIRSPMDRYDAYG